MLGRHIQPFTSSLNIQFALRCFSLHRAPGKLQSPGSLGLAAPRVPALLRRRQHSAKRAPGSVPVGRQPERTDNTVWRALTVLVCDAALCNGTKPLKAYVFSSNFTAARKRHPRTALSVRQSVFANVMIPHRNGIAESHKI